MIFLHLVNLVTRTHETDETQSISWLSPCVWTWRFFVLHLYCNLSRGGARPSGKTVWTCFNTHLTHFNTTHLPKEPVNFRAKGAFMIAVSYKTMLYLYPPTISNFFCLFKHKCFFKLAVLCVWRMKNAPFFQILAQGSSLLVHCFFPLVNPL